MEASRRDQEKLSRRSRSPEHAAVMRPGNRSNADAGTVRGEETGKQHWRSTRRRPDQGG